MKTFNILNVSSKFAICGLPLRADTYKTCSFGCAYCFSNNRKIMEFEKTLQIGNLKQLEKTLNRVLDMKDIKSDNFIDVLLSNGLTWHLGGMSDPFQPCEDTYHVTEELYRMTAKYGISILASTKTCNLYGAWKYLNPDLHTFQMSVSNVFNHSIEPNIPKIEQRLSLYKELKQKGFRVGIRIQPFIPGITTTDIIDMFNDADHFVIEGIKLVPQNASHVCKVLEMTGLDKSLFTQMGLLNLKPEIRLSLYNAFIDKFEREHLSYSIADNDMHYMGTSMCCCGDALITKSAGFDTTAMTHKFGTNYTLEQVNKELCLHQCADCKCSHLFTSNRTNGCSTVTEFYDERFSKPSSPFSPKFLYKKGEQ